MHRTFGLLGALALGSCARPRASPSPVPIAAADSVALFQHLAVLAHDSMLGRAPGTRGYDRAAAYVADAFRRAGLQPVAASFLVDVPLTEAVLDRSSARLSVTSANGTTSFAFGSQFIVGGSFRGRDARDAPVVYVQQGVVAPWRRYDDYSGVDVRGAFVAFSPGAPADVFSLEERAYIEQVKVRTAIAKGAAGTIQLAGSMTTTAEWIAFASAYSAVPTVGLGSGTALAPSVFGAGTNLVLGPEATRAVRATGARISLQTQSMVRPLRSANVIGRLLGSDPVLSKEYVVLGAHLDHLGVGAPVAGDSIYNGAVDNAAGVAMMIEMARIIAHSRPLPRRSLLFVAFTAEEAGGLGSEHFLTDAPVPRSAIAAMANLDGVGVWPFDAIVARGADLSNLAGTVERGAADAGARLVPDPVPTRAAMTGSDQFSFATSGIPAMSFTSARSAEGRAQALDWVARRYHQPSDDMQQPMSMGAASALATVLARVVVKIADMPDRPKWRDGVFYGTLR